MFEGFETAQVDVGEASAFVRFGGEGPPVVLLLHGHPRTSATWHWVAPLLVQAGHTVVCPDLRGCGRSRGPRFTADHVGYSERAVAGDVAAVMRHLGHDRFALVGHDRGGAVALRLTLDHPETVSQVAFVDCVPTAIAAHCCRPCARDRYTVDSTGTTALHGATNATGACSHHPATAHPRQAASAALPACTVRSRSRPGPRHARRTAVPP
ncbi:hypothetical protein GCM10012280_64720 [Wenjunlia tyrosinilytica]|uniref:AB hydrolase-1 domain-containing protein n=1 Tax=Wenjunlia tyrosinilytica TaxID=1544741 RepID=A0A917ZYT5_9ACTN|nr:hypothetical protein GCM10012280_64720 [Wenjunlia tyrosinilytica]